VALLAGVRGDYGNVPVGIIVVAIGVVIWLIAR